MTLDELVAVLRVHQGPFFDGVTSRCGCRRIVQTADEWARHVAEELRAARTITTVEQMDALPVGAVVLDDMSDVLQRFNADGGWLLLGYGGLHVPVLPARLLCNLEDNQ